MTERGSGLLVMSIVRFVWNSPLGVFGGELFRRVRDGRFDEFGGVG